MKKNYLFLMFLFLTSVVFGQTTVTIGTGGSTSGTNDWGNPIYRSAPTSSFNFSQSVHLYNSTQLNGVGITSGATVTAMGFHKTTASTLSAGRTATLNIYMKNSTATALVNNQSMAVWTTGATLVYSNPAVTPADLVNIGANSFTFTAPFNYTGQNVEVAWDWEINAGTGNPTDGSFLWSYDAATAQAVGRASGSAITLDLTTVQPRTYKADFTFTAGAACTGTPAPGNTISSDPSICATLPFTLSLQNFTGGAGVSYQWESADDAAFTLGVASLGTSITQSTSQTSDKYYRCTVTCAGNTGVSTPVLVTMNAPTSCYCDPTYANGGGGDNIANVTLGILSNSTTGNVAPYYTFYNTLAIPDIGQSTNADVSITMGTDGNQWAAVWIDFNQDGIFDASEGVVSTANAGGGGTVIISVPVPAGATLGNTRMRVRGGNDSQLTTAQACGASSSPWGESEDYLVNITLPPACLATNGLIASVANATTAQLDWDITASGSGYNWEIRTSGLPGSGATGLTASGSTLTALDTFVIVSTLSSQTVYSAYVRTDCGTGTSVWSSSVTFTTPCSTLALPWLDDVEAETATTNATFGPTSCWTNTPTATTALYRWNITGSGTTGSGGTGAASANSGTNYFYTEASQGATGAVAELVSPVIDISTLTVPSLNYFLHMFGTQFGSLNIDINDGTGWVNDVATVTGAQQAAQADPFIEQIVNLGAFTATGTVQIRFRAIKGAGFSGDICLDDISVVELPACTFPSGPSASPASATSAILSWTENGTATAWNIIYGAPGFDPLTAGTTVAAGTNPYTLTGLSASTSYDFYVQSDCGGGTLSTLSGAGSFITPCLPVVAPWIDNVELQSTTTNATFDPAQCWTTNPAATTAAYRWNVTGSGTTTSTLTGASSANSGVKYYYSEASSGAAGAVAELYTPFIDVTALTTPALEFYTHMWGGDITGLNVDVFDGTTWTNDVYVLSGPQTVAQADPFDFNLVNLSAYSGTIQIRFRVIRGASFDGDVCIDDISVVELPLCPDPSGVSATFVSSTSANIAWTENGTATTWTIEYGPTGFTPGTGTTVAAATNPFVVTGITCGAAYDFYVISDCGINGTATSASPANVDLGACACTGTPAPGATLSSSGPAVCPGVAFDLSFANTTAFSGQTYQWESSSDLAFTTPVILGSTTPTQNIPTQGPATYYRCLVSCTASASSTYSTPVFVDSSTYCPCIPTYSTGKTAGDLIANVEILGTTLANNTGTAAVNPAYTYFTGAPNLTATLQAGNAYTVSVSVGSFGNQNMAAWIDYNDNAVFEPSERIGFTTASINGFGTATFPIVLACNPPLGTHRMRIRDNYALAGISIDPCANYTWGEAEDYDITIVAAVACPAPTGVTSFNSTATTIDLGWAIGCSETAWNVIYGPVGFDPLTAGTTVSASNDTTTITGLTCGTPYDFYVLADCGGAGPSIPSFVASGSTAGCPSLAITAMIEGYYLPGTGLMKSVIANSQFLPPTLECDTLTVELHDPLSTLSVPLVAQSFTGVLATDGTMDMTWPLTIAGNSYYIVLKHRNALGDMECSPVTINAGTTYDFTVQANVFGNNVKLVNPGVYALFSGNLNGDGFIDVGDYPVWETSSNAFAFGYVSADINGDGLVDLSDYTIWEGNSNAFVFVFAPF